VRVRARTNITSARKIHSNGLVLRFQQSRKDESYLALRDGPIAFVRPDLVEHFQIKFLFTLDRNGHSILCVCV
jgi:hypothetical protein